MRALVLIADRQMELRELTPPAPPGDGEVQVRVKVMALNHIDVWGYRGMAFDAANSRSWSGQKRLARSPPSGSA